MCGVVARGDRRGGRRRLVLGMAPLGLLPTPVVEGGRGRRGARRWSEREEGGRRIDSTGQRMRNRRMWNSANVNSHHAPGLVRVRSYSTSFAFPTAWGPAIVGPLVRCAISSSRFSGPYRMTAPPRHHTPTLYLAGSYYPTTRYTRRTAVKNTTTKHGVEQWGHSATVQKPQLQLLGSRHPPDTPDIRTSICIRVCSLARQARPVSSLTKSRDDQGSGVGRQVPAPVKPLATPRSDTGPCKRKTRGKAFWLNHVFSYILIDLHTLLCLCPRLPPLSPLSRDLHKRRRRRERATLRPSSSTPLNLSLLPP